MPSENLLNRILDAPVGHVLDIIKDTLNDNIELVVIEQNRTADNQFVRKIAITAHGLPLIKAEVKFDSAVLPEFIMVEILKKKQGIGTILSANHIKATRNILYLERNHEENKALRKYKIINNEIVWFTISEEIRLGNLDSNKYG